MDWIDSEPPLLIDGAHNPAGMAAMVASARELIGGRRCVAVFAAMRNKDVAIDGRGARELTQRDRGHRSRGGTGDTARLTSHGCSIRPQRSPAT